MALCWLTEIGIGALLAKTEYIHELLYISPFYRVIDFFIGILLGTLFLELKVWECCWLIRNKIALVFLQGFSMAAFGFMVLYWSRIPIGFRYSAAYSPFIGIMIFLLGVDTGGLSSFMGNTIFRFMSKISFEMFMIHQIVIRYLDEYCINVFYIPNPWYFALVIGITIILAFTLHGVLAVILRARISFTENGRK